MQYLWILLFSICQSGGMVEYICQDKQCFLRFYIPRSGEQNSTERLPTKLLAHPGALCVANHFQPCVIISTAQKLQKLQNQLELFMGMPKYVLMTVQTEKNRREMGKSINGKHAKHSNWPKHCVPKLTFPRFLWEGLFVQRSGFGNQIWTPEVPFIYVSQFGVMNMALVMVMVSECSRRRFGFKMMIMSRLMGKIT